MRRIYVPSTGADDWQWLLAQPGLHWKPEHSAMSLAETWDAGDPWPPSVASALAGSSLGKLELLLGLPEHEVPLDGGGAASQTDLFVLARGSGGLVSIAVEGKVDEPFGDTVDVWRKDDSAGKQKRLSQLLASLGLEDDGSIGDLRYQLLHRTASAILEAQRFGAQDAVMLVHSFSASQSSLAEFQAFCSIFGVEAKPGSIVSAGERSGVKLHLGWISDPHPPHVRAAGLGIRFDRALGLARELHVDQKRKSTEIPYLAHLLGVTSLVLEDGGNEDEAIAALLHDAVEDQGGQPTLRRIRRQFGSRVAEIVLACSDSDVVPRPPWRERKEAYLAHVADVDAGILRVSLADKLHNARAILFDLNDVGDHVWSRFKTGRDDQLWYYGALADAFAARNAGPMVQELRRVLAEIAAKGN